MGVILGPGIEIHHDRTRGTAVDLNDERIALPFLVTDWFDKHSSHHPSIACLPLNRFSLPEDEIRGLWIRVGQASPAPSIPNVNYVLRKAVNIGWRRRIRIVEKKNPRLIVFYHGDNAFGLRKRADLSCLCRHREKLLRRSEPFVEVDLVVPFPPADCEVSIKLAAQLFPFASRIRNTPHVDAAVAKIG